MSMNSPDSARLDQSAFAVVWNRTIRPDPRAASVTSGVPSASAAQVWLCSSAEGTASTCRLTRTSSGTVRPPNGRTGREGGDARRLAPGQRAPELAVPAQQLDRQQGIALVEGRVGGARSGEAHQQAAFLHPGRDGVTFLAWRQRPVREHQHGEIALQQRHAGRLPESR